jgi:hypothetical protein
METPTYTTLLNLVQTVNMYAANDDEVVATVVYLVNSGKVVLCGNFTGAKIDCSALNHAAPYLPPKLLSILQACDIEAKQPG